MVSASAPPVWDVVVVGAGMAGAAAVRRLDGLRVLWCEGAPVRGGRVRTVDVEGRPAELGAMFVSRRIREWIDPEALFVPREGDCMALLPDGTLLQAGSRAALLASAGGMGMQDRVRDALLSATHFAGAARLNRHVAALAAVDQGAEQPAAGVQPLLDAMATTATVHCTTGARVEAITVGHDDYRVVVLRDGASTVETTRAVVLATDMVSARKLVGASGMPLPPYLAALEAQPAAVAVFSACHERASLPNYVVVLDGPVNTLAFTAAAGDVVTVAAWGVGDAIAMLDDASLQQVIQACLDKIPGGCFSALTLAHRQYWPVATVPVDDRQLALWRRDDCVVHPGLFLAGDYLYPAHAFGLEPAFITGTQAGERARLHARAMLITPATPEDAARQVLAGLRTDLQRVLQANAKEVMAALSPHEPPQPVGDVVAVAAAIGGLRAAGVGEGDPLLARALQWLQGARQDGMWAYTRGGLPTATDSALVTFFVPECDWSACLPDYCTASGVLPQLSAEDVPVARRMPVRPATMHWCQPDPFTTLLCAANEARAGRPPLLDEDALQRLFRKRHGLFVANPFLAELAFVLAAQQQGSAVADDLIRNVLAGMMRARNENGLFGQFDAGLSTAAAVLGIAVAGAGRLTAAETGDLRAALGRAAAATGATPFCSTACLGRAAAQRHSALPFHEQGDMLELHGKLYALTLYRDSLDLVARGLWLMAYSQLEHCEAPALHANGFLNALPRVARPPALKCRSVSQYCAYVLPAFR